MNRRDALKSLLAAPPATGLAFVSEQGEVLPIASVNVLQLQKDDLVVAEGARDDQGHQVVGRAAVSVALELIRMWDACHE